MSVDPASFSIPLSSDAAAVTAVFPTPAAVADAAGRRLAVNRAFQAAAGWSDAAAADSATVAQWPAGTTFTPFGDAGLRLATLPPQPPPQSPPQSEASAPETARRILNALPVMAGGKDAEGRYLFMNAYQAAHFGIAAEQALGRRLGDLAGERYDDHLGDLDREVLRTGAPVGFFEIDGAGVDGELRRWLAFKGPLRGDDGAIDGVAFLAVDVTDRKEREDALRHAYAHSEESVRTRGRYLATLGHELKTPLHSIVGFSEFLAQETLGPLGHGVYRDYAQDIVDAGRHLLELVTGILDMAKLEAGRLPLEEEEVDLARTLADVARMLALPARGKGVDVRVEASGAVPHVVADPRRIRQILVNLLNNAVKFTPAGGSIVMRTALTEAGEPALEVQDDGAGIPPEQIALALTPFGRVQSTDGPTPDGAGLGLPLVKALAEAHGGRLELLSAPGQGVTARVILPCCRLHRRPAAPTAG